MSRNSLVAAFGVFAGAAAILAAQTSSNVKADRRPIQSIKIKVIGCVVSAKEAGHYRLVDAISSADAARSVTGTAGKSAAAQDVSFENSPSFDLIGANLTSHMGHRVEVVGITSDTKLNNSDAFRAAIGSSAPDAATLTVTSIKTIAATCPLP
jgi:hypothetical protein